MNKQGKQHAMSQKTTPAPRPPRSIARQNHRVRQTVGSGSPRSGEGLVVRFAPPFVAWMGRIAPPGGAFRPSR